MLVTHPAWTCAQDGSLRQCNIICINCNYLNAMYKKYLQHYHHAGPLTKLALPSCTLLHVQRLSQRCAVL
jgi:hypothetical protein